MFSLFSLALLIAEPTYSMNETISQCAGIANNDVRLECFDQLAAAVTGGAVAGAPAAPSQKMAREGTDPDETPARQAAAPEGEKEPRFIVMRSDDPKVKAMERSGVFSGFFRREPYESAVIATKRNNMGILFIELENGEIWRENRASLRHDPKIGEKVTLDPGATGGWFAEFADMDRKTKMRRFDIDD